MDELMVSKGKDSQISELREFTEQFVDSSRRGVMVSVKDDELSVSLLGVSSLECYALLRAALKLTIEGIENTVKALESQEERH